MEADANSGRPGRDEERYRILFENSPVAMWEEDFSAVRELIERCKSSGIKDIRAHLQEHPEVVQESVRLIRVIGVNRRARNFYGIGDKEKLLTALPAMFDAAAYGIFREELSDFAEGKPEFRAEVAVADAGGERRVVDMQVSMVPVEEAPWSRVIVAFTDITERKRLEEQVAHAEKLEGIGRLAGGIAQDFNNLLMVINGYSELMLEMVGEASPLQQPLTEVRKAGARAQALTQQLLAFSRKQILIPRVLDLNALVAEAEVTIRRVMGEAILVETVLDPDLAPVSADPQHLEQALVNLAVNARDAMPEGGRLTIRTANVELNGAEGIAPAGSYVLLAVDDTGAGLDAGTVQRLFEPFFTTKQVGEGSGLGLATVFGTVKQSGGEIRGYGEPGRGTTFEIYLPRLEQAPSSGVAQAEAPESAETRTILIVEDQEGVRKLVRDVLASQGFEVLEAADGAAALAVCERREGTIHLLVTDVVMPEMTGWEVADRIRVQRPQLKVLYVSGFSGGDLPELDQAEGQWDFMPKPFSPQALVSKVRELLG